jgi:hypothetical protein
MSDLITTKQLNGCAATFRRFAGPDRFVIEVNGIGQTVTRDFWRTLSKLESAKTQTLSAEKLGWVLIE